MPSRPKKPSKTEAAKSDAISSKAQAASGIIKEQRIQASGLTSRTLGHVSAAGKRSQAKRDSK